MERGAFCVDTELIKRASLVRSGAGAAASMLIMINDSADTPLGVIPLPGCWFVSFLPVCVGQYDTYEFALHTLLAFGGHLRLN